MLEGNGGNIVAKLAVKNGKEAMNTSQLYLIVRLKNSQQWKEYLVSNPAGANWEEKEIALSDLTSSDVIDRIGLRVKNTNSDFNMLVGKLELSDNFTAKTLCSKRFNHSGEGRKENFFIGEGYMERGMWCWQ